MDSSLLTAVLSLAWIVSTWTSNFDEFSKIDSATFFAHTISIVLLELSIALGVKKLAARRLLPRQSFHVLLAGFCVFNLHTLVLIHNESIASLPDSQSWLMLAAIWFGFYMLLEMAAESRPMRSIFIGCLVLFLAQTVGTFAWSEYNAKETRRTLGQIPAHFEFPAFTKHPNVYLISFDALVPEAITKKFIGIDSLSYMPVLRRHDLHILKNAFCERVPTQPCFNAFAAMDLAYYDGLKRPFRFMLATGEITNPLYELFRANGYKIRFVYESSYFGPPTRANLDRYEIANQAGVCIHVDNPYSFMGYCTEAMSALRNTLLGHRSFNYPEFLFDRIRAGAAEPGPWLTLAYIRQPGHTPKHYTPSNPAEVEEFKKSFLERVDIAAQHMEDLIRSVKESDPNSILIIFGDHGAYMTREEPGDNKQLQSDSEARRNMIQDRHGVVAAIYPKEFCSSEFREPYGVVRLGRTLSKCLSGGKDPLPESYQPDDGFYRDYLYE